MAKFFIPIYDFDNGYKFMEIDNEDYEKVNKYKWFINKISNTEYAHKLIYNEGEIETIYAHRIIMDLGDYKNDKRIIKHIDGNGLNNKKANLHVYKKKCYKKKCYYFEKNTKKWIAKKIIKGKRHQKKFSTEKEAKEYIDNLINKHLYK